MSLMDNYPVMSLCISESMAGNCGANCRGYILGDCPIADEISNEIADTHLPTPWRKEGF